MLKVMQAIVEKVQVQNVSAVDTGIKEPPHDLKHIGRLSGAANPYAYGRFP